MSRRILVLAAVLAVALVAGCSRQSTHHLGEWDAQLFNVGNPPVGGGTFLFSEDGKVKAHWETSGGPVDWKGEYKIDYSKDPVQLEIKWEDKAPVNIHGSVRFFEEGKTRMEYLFAMAGEPRPTDFNHPKSFYWLKKKVKK